MTNEAKPIDCRSTVEGLLCCARPAGREIDEQEMSLATDRWDSNPEWPAPLIAHFGVSTSHGMPPESLCCSVASSMSFMEERSDVSLSFLESPLSSDDDPASAVPLPILTDTRAFSSGSVSPGRASRWWRRDPVIFISGELPRPPVVRLPPRQSHESLLPFFDSADGGSTAY
eukprot:Gregarina_sp_Poly_1__3086@NODE_186_length_11711_cov_65_603057_g165_i0_p7_GENE_NODE_186_length_11711_cov_65_603057_g165_i0NODE_186_length_11711_cov_65_603057_g165_i0_p7_ORF_typecomplete_len172_score26_73_NODE_186_length_11711_cov_65_603057_g165_i054495964